MVHIETYSGEFFDSSNVLSTQNSYNYPYVPTADYGRIPGLINSNGLYNLPYYKEEE